MPSPVVEITPEELAESPPDLLLDVREPAEYARGRIPDARLVPLGRLEREVPSLTPPPGGRIVLYCEVGQRSAVGARLLAALGYRHVRSLAGGIERWAAEGRPVVRPAGLVGEQWERYDRHLRLAEIGVEGQRRLLAARVLVVGAGGLGSPAALYLAAAGVGTIGIVDDDRVECSNLQRQILHGSSDLGLPKVVSATERIRDLNPDVQVVAHGVRLDADNAETLLAGYEVVVDGSDNLPTRYVLNDAAARRRLPVVHGAIHRFEGQVTVFRPGVGPCYRCLFPEPPPPETAPSCAELGVVGAMPGVVGSLQALETLKLLLGIGDPLVGRLLCFDALGAASFEVRIRPDPTCPVCGATAGSDREGAVGTDRDRDRRVDAVASGETTGG
ncbi:MAG TPA: molybdopterin-synthase adenylyltransferase MoeB [Actinobacteria bacterium]|nr:molybdopterin-synthase adenylyltransferase MoeB [Actinomycetota bacterium]